MIAVRTSSRSELPIRPVSPLGPRDAWEIFASNPLRVSRRDYQIAHHGISTGDYSAGLGCSTCELFHTREFSEVFGGLVGASGRFTSRYSMVVNASLLDRAARPQWPRGGVSDHVGAFLIRNEALRSPIALLGVIPRSRSNICGLTSGGVG